MTELYHNKASFESLVKMLDHVIQKHHETYSVPSLRSRVSQVLPELLLSLRDWRQLKAAHRLRAGPRRSKPKVVHARTAAGAEQMNELAN